MGEFPLAWAACLGNETVYNLLLDEASTHFISVYILFYTHEQQAWYILKGPKHEKFVSGNFTQIRPAWIGELETRPKTSTKLMVGALYLFLSAKFSVFLNIHVVH
jgi:hypothetical protein